MSLLHALVAREDCILAEHDATPGGGTSYSQATQTILSKIPPSDSKLTYAADNILFHYTKSAGVVVLCIADDGAGRRMPFAFLAELHKQFTATFGADAIADAPPYGMASFGGDIAKLMKRFVESPPNDPIKAAQAELDSVKSIMVKNLDQVLSRGERIELLVNKTDAMSTQARAFRKRSTALRRKMWWKNTKVMVLLAPYRDSDNAVSTSAFDDMSEPYDPYLPSGNSSANPSGAPAPGGAAGNSKTAAIQAQIDDTVGIMRENITKVAERGEHLNALQDKTDNLAVSAQGFRRGANRVRKQMWWKDMKMRILIGVGIAVLVIIIVVPIVVKK